MLYVVDLVVFNTQLFNSLIVSISMIKILLTILVVTISAQAQRNRVDNAPKVGDAIPKVSAHAIGDFKKVDLSNPTKPTVLIFGSHT